MEDIRVYLDSTDGSYHKGEAAPFGVFAGVVLLAIGGFWILQGGWFLLKYGSAFSQAAGAIQVDTPSEGTCWTISALRLLMGLFIGWVGLQAWDMKRGFLHWTWILAPFYLWYWGSWLVAVDPEFRAAELTLDKIATYPVCFVMVLSLVLVAVVLLGSFVQTWAFRAAREDLNPVILGVVVAVVFGGLYMFTEAVPPGVRATGMVYGIAPLDAPASGLGILKLIALSQDELLCHENMDKLQDGLEKVEQLGRKIMYSAYSDRPGGERLVRMVQQMAGVDSKLACPSGGWYRVGKNSGVWHCSAHGDRVPPEERTMAGPAGGAAVDSGSDFESQY